MNLSKKIISAMVVIAMFIAILYAGKIVKTEEEKNVFDNTLELEKGNKE